MSVISDRGLVHLYWQASGDDWAIPDEVMVKYGRAVIAEIANKLDDLARIGNTPHSQLRPDQLVRAEAFSKLCAEHAPRQTFTEIAQAVAGWLREKED